MRRLLYYFNFSEYPFSVLSKEQDIQGEVTDVAGIRLKALLVNTSKHLLIIFIGMALSLQLYAQTKQITGRVTDQGGDPVVAASVQVKGNSVGTTTDFNGNFTLNLPQNSRTLVISAVGYGTQEVAIGAQTVININLVQGTGSLQEVVVTGYTRERKSNFAGAATILNAERTVATVPVGAFDQALQGRAPGVLVNSGSGQPGSSANVMIRGPQSISGAFAQPLYVIDGVPLPSFDMQTINPNDFESITVLKDASAAALYGARGGTGVIVITTKKGKQGTNFQYRGQAGVTQRPDFSRLNLMNTAEILAYEERIGDITKVSNSSFNVPGWVYSPKNPANANLPATSPANNPFGASQARYAAILDSIRGIDMNYADIFYRQGTSQTHELNMSTGTEKTKLYVSGQYFHQEGIDRFSSLDRYTGRFNIDHTSGRFNVQWNTIAGYSNSSFAEGEWLGNSPRNPFQMTFRAKPYEYPYNPDGTPRFGTSTSLNLRQVGNLLEGLENSTYSQNQIKVNSGLTFNYSLLDNLSLRNTTGIDASTDDFQRTVNANSYIGSLQTYQSGTYLDAHRVISQIINTTSALFNQRFADKHDVELGAYFEVIRGRQRGFSMQLYNLDPRLSQTGQGAGQLATNGAANMPQNATAAKTGFGIRSYFANARYSFDNKYTVTGSIRRDGTSRIVNLENREVTTWSAGLIWNAIREGFLANQSFLNDLRVRASYGIIPNIGSIPTGSYFFSQSIASITNYQGPQVPTFGTTTYAGSSLPGLAPSTPGNPDLAIEKVQKANIGIDLTTWNNRARFTVDLYRNRTVDMYVSQPLSFTSGFASQNINAGVMTNKGIEAQVSVDVVKSKDFGFTLGVNHAINKNNIESLGSVDEYPLGTFLIKVGLPYGSLYYPNYLGVDPQTGKPLFETLDGKTTDDLAQAGQFAKYGTFIPKHVGGFTADLNFKRFSASALFSYQFDVVRSNNQRNWMVAGTPSFVGAVNASRELLTDQWQKPGDVARLSGPQFSRGFTSLEVEDAKFLRFRNLTVAYQIPTIRVGGTDLMKGARFYVQGQNLAIWSPWTGLDPEDNNNVSLNEYPNPKMFVLGLDINF